MVGLNSEDIHAEWQRLKEAGVEFVEEPTLYEDLWIATLKDPEGNLVQLFDYRPNPA
jgi:predicted enzyme related to lactoylglutathione lyase